MNGQIELLLKKIEEEAKLIKSEASKREMQEILRERLLLEEEKQKLLRENGILKEQIVQYQRENAKLQADLERILEILNGENIPADDTMKQADASIIETNSDAQKARRLELKEMLKENAQIFEANNE